MAAEGNQEQDGVKIFGHNREGKKQETEENIICMIK